MAIAGNLAFGLFVAAHQAAFYGWAMEKLPHTRSCFVCGDSNPMGLKLGFETDGTRVHSRFTPRPEHVGFKGVIHGGLLSTWLDEMMVWACAVQTHRFAYCTELTVRFVKTARPHEPLRGTAELTLNRKNKLFEVKSELRNEREEIVAEGTGKYFAVRASDLRGMVDDFVGDFSPFLEEPPAFPPPRVVEP
jgi:acyl-coenzyme A thioesterase PaaI-like protein